MNECNQSVGGSDLAEVGGFAFMVESRVVKLTDAAIEKMGACLFGSADYAALVIAAEKGGCSGRKYVMSIILRETYDESNDLHALCSIKRDGACKFVVTRDDSLMFIAGMTIDYVSSETGGGFLFSNPNAVSSCGCGESFNVNE